MKHPRFPQLTLVLVLAGLSAGSPAGAMTGPVNTLGLVRRLVDVGALSAPGASAQRIALGPEGELEMRAEAEPLALDSFLLNALRQDGLGLVEERRPDGSVMIHLQGRYQSASVARVGASGVVVDCTSGHDATSRCLHEPAPARGREER